jgi:hypothetical protein
MAKELRNGETTTAKKRYQLPQRSRRLPRNLEVYLQPHRALTG